MFEVKTRMNALLEQARSTSAKMSRGRKPVDWKDPALTLSAYSECCNHRHDGSGVDLGDLVRLFVKCSPPFSKKKREEFKDAIAALSLHRWAVQNDEIIYIISKDKDWKDACAVFPHFESAKLGDIVRMLHELNSERADIDNNKIEQTIEVSEGHLITDLDSKPPQCDKDGIQAACESTSLRIVVQKTRIRDGQFWARASFSGSVSAEFVDRHGNVFGFPSFQIEGILNAVLDSEYTLLEVNIFEWSVDLAQDPARQDSFLIKLPLGDQS